MIRCCESWEDGEKCERTAVAEVASAQHYGAQSWDACARHALRAKADGCEVLFDSEVSQ
jgi:hypothetical protein